MRLRPRLIALSLVTVSLLLASSGDAQEKFKLKPGAQGKICLNCHVTFSETLKNPFVHTPVKSGNCTGCHSPHTSSHGKFLAAEPNAICITCHTQLIPEKPVSLHKVVADGACTKCHNPHGSPNKFNLVKGGNTLCFECHKELADRVSNVKFKHKPVEQGCTGCHSPHASVASEKLLKSTVPSLCVKCHDTGRLIFQKQHMNYPVAGARCTACHNPHGSNRKGLLYDKTHSPFEKRMCNQCHMGPSSPTPLKTVKTGYPLCMGCHSTMINEMFSKNHIHWPLLDQTGCINCHSPHASDNDGLLKKPPTETCGQCHTDTVDRLKRAQSKHPPVQEGMCATCHSPHASDQPLLISQPTVIELCTSCHSMDQHASHPMGAEIVDPRNKNLRVACTSCHKAHGTEYKKLLNFPSSTELCTECHKGLKR